MPDYLFKRYTYYLTGIGSALASTMCYETHWLTGATSLLRETVGLVENLRAEGCIAVEMELAGVQALCDFYCLKLFNFLEAGDVLESSGYDVEGLRDANHNLGKLYIALNTALLL